MNLRKTIRKTLTGVTVVALIAFGTGGKASLADTEKEKITVPIDQVTLLKDECQLTPSQLVKEEVEISHKCVNQDYLEEHGHEKHKTGKNSDREGIGQDVTLKDSPDNPDFGNIDQFRIHDYDGDENVEGVFADNQIVNGEKRALLAFYPFGEEDGNPHNIVYIMEGQHVNEIREDDIDGDEKQEIGIYGERDAITTDWEIGEQDLDFDKYEAPRGKTITDGQLLDGKHFIAVNNQDGDDYEFDFYQMEDGDWKPVLSESTKEHVLQNLPDITSSFSPEEFLVGDFDDDGKYEILTSDDKMSIYANDEVGFVYNKFPENPEGEPVDLSGDYQYANPVPWDSDEKKIVSVPDTEAQEKYNMGDSEKVVFITQSPAPGKKEANLGEMEPLSAISKSGKIITDFQTYPYRESLPEEAQEVEGTMGWVKFWQRNFPNYNPWVISTKNDSHISVDEDKHFRSMSPYNPSLSEHVENSKAQKME